MFPKLNYILTLGCAVSLNLNTVVSAQENLTPAIITNTFPASSYTLPPSLATIGSSLSPAVISNTFPASSYILPSSLATITSTALSSSSQGPASTSAASTSSGTRTISQSPTGTGSASATTSSSAARKFELDFGPWAVLLAVGGVGWLGILV